MVKENNIKEIKISKKELDDQQLSKIVNVLDFMRTQGTAEITRIDKVDVRVAEWSRFWIENFCGNIKKNTLVYYDSVVELHINRVLGHILLVELTAEDVQLFINSLSLGIGTNKKLSPKSVKNIHGILHKCLDTAVMHHYIPINPSTRTILPCIQHRNLTVMSSSMLGEFMRLIEGKEKEDFYLFAVFTGMRESEIIGLTWDCVNFKNGSIHIYRQLTKDRMTRQFIFTSLKNNKARVIYPSDFVMNLLAKIKKTVPATEENFVFVSQKTGTHFTVQAVEKTFKRIVTRMGYPKLRVHDLRHTYAVLSLEAGDDIKALQCNLGHFSSAFTLDVYGHYTQDMQKKSAKKMSTFISENYPELGRH